MKYSAIIGINPSKGARSPILWNKAFKYFGYKIKMRAIDVEKEDLEKVFINLKNDINFIGGAVTNPYKEVIAKLLDGNLTKEAKKIGAINCLYRNEKNELFGTNTDGEAALKSYISEFGQIDNKNILIIGLGGAGKAVSTYFAYSCKNRIKCVSRNSNDKLFCKTINVDLINFRQIKEIINQMDIVINCTSIGSNLNINESPLDQDSINKLKKNAVIFDIIYNPLETNLLKISKKNKLKTFNGLEMNLIQAVLAYHKAAPGENNILKIREAMTINE